MKHTNINYNLRLQKLITYVMIISIMLVSFAFPASHAYAKRDSYGYSYDIDPGYRNSNWMQNLRDDVRISELSIMGTHNSMSLYGGGGPYPDDYIRTQRMSLATQLHAGIRYLDIRVRHLNDTFAINHGRVYQNAYLGPDVLNKIIEFLKINPQETILMRLKQECVDKPSIGECTDLGNTRTFSDTFEHEYYNNTRYSSYFWKNNHHNSITNNNPKLGEVRGKIIVLENFPVSKVFGIPYENLDIQDYFDVDNEPNAMYEKWTQIKSHLIKANTVYGHTIFLNHLSGNGGWRFFTKGASPYFVASGQYHKNTGGERTLLTPIHGREPVDLGSQYPDYPRLYSPDYNMNFIYYEGTNILTTEKIQEGRIHHTGIIAADFPGKSLIDSVIKLNNIHNHN